MIERIVSDLVESNVFVISKDDACIIVDAGAQVDEVTQVVGNRKVEAIFLTHGHYDHCHYIEDYVKAFACKVYCSEKTKEYLKNPNYNYSDGHLKIDDFLNFEFLQDTGIVKLPHFVVEYHALGGHSFADMCFQIEDSLFVGDVVVGRDIGRMDLYGGDKNGMIKSLKFLLEQNYQILYFGHGEENTKENQDKIIKLWIKYLNR